MEIQSEEIKDLIGALVKVQSAMKPAGKAADNPFFKSKYADLTAVIDVSRDLLTKNGLAVTQPLIINGDDVQLCTQITHTTGQWMRSYYPVKPTKEDPQGMGSAVTYARRYSYCSLVGVVTDDDDDGNAASEEVKSPPVFSSAAMRKKFCENVLGSVAECATEEEIDAIMKLNAPKIKLMQSSGNEHDSIGVDEIKTQVELARIRVESRAMDQQFNEATQ